MSTPEPEMQTYREALEALRQRSHRLKQAGVAALIVIGALLVAGEVRIAGLAVLMLGVAMLLVRQSLSASRFLVAEKFILTDEQGNVRAILGMDEEFSTLRFFAKSGQTVLDLSASSDYSSILLAPETGEDSAHLASATKTGPMLTLTSAFGKAMMGSLQVPGAEHLAEQWAPGPVISLNDATGRKRVSLAVVSGELGETTFDLADGAGTAEASFYVAEGATRLEFKEQGAFRTVLGRSRVEGLRGLVLFDKDGEVIWQAP